MKNITFKMFIFAITVTLVLTKVLGIPQIHSNIVSPLSGQYCPGNVTITCNALEFGISGILDWYLNDTRLLRYSYSPDNNFPLTLTLESQILNATAQISSATFDGTQYNFENFTLSVNLDDLLNFQGHSITCGTLGVRSNAFTINNFYILGTLDVSYIAIYQGEKGVLAEIYVQWTYLVEMLNCQITTLYTIQLVDSNGVKTIQTLTMKDCVLNNCSVQFSLSLTKSTESYSIYLVASSQHMNHHYTHSSMFTLDSRRYLVHNGGCNNLSTVTCPTSAHGVCSINLVNKIIPISLMPGEAYILNSEETSKELEVITKINSATIIQKININNSCSESVNYIHMIWTILLSSLLLISGIIMLSIIMKLKSKKENTSVVKYFANKQLALSRDIIKRNKVSVVMKENQSYESNLNNKSKEEDFIVMTPNQLYEVNKGKSVKKQEELISMNCNKLYELNAEKSTDKHDDLKQENYYSIVDKMDLRQ